LNTTLTPHSIIHGHACFAYFNKIWGIPVIETLNRYGLTADKSEWIAQQWGRAHLGLHHYEEAIAIFRKSVSSESANPYSFTYLARALQQYGDLNGAIKVLRQARVLYPDNVSILTSLGVDLERARSDGEALDILLPVFEAAPRNTRAALAIIRIRIREGRIPEAEKIFRRAQPDVPSAMKPFLISAQADLIAQGRPRSAIDLLQPEAVRDEHLIGLLLEAFIQGIAQSPDARTREEFIKQALAISVPDRWRKNVPVAGDAGAARYRSPR
jgi:tetratricopeptide (TPR) repeat protein